MGRKSVFHKVWLYGLILLVCSFCLFPFFWSLSTSFKTMAETHALPPTFIPKQPTFMPYIELFQAKIFARWLLNSFIVALSTTILSIFAAVFAGYAAARFNFPGRLSFLFLILMTYMFPGTLVLVPLYLIFLKLRLVDTYLALILAFTSFALPFCVWMLKGFFDFIPSDLEDAAMIDGCTRIGAFMRVILPLAIPGVIATAIFAFLTAWNEFLFAFVLTNTESMRTAPVGLYMLIGEYLTVWNQFMAASVVITLPVIALFIFLQRYLVQGLTAGAVKG